MTRQHRMRVAIGMALAGLTFGSAVQAQANSAVAITPNEKAQGAKAHPQLLEEYGGAYAGPQADYVRRVGQKIAVQSGLSNSQGDFTVTLLDSSVNNAFAIPGGYVYVTRQLLALMNDEAELASVMGHEVGHVAAHHARKRNQTSTIAAVLAGVVGAVAGNSTLGTLVGRGAGMGAQLVTLGFSRSQENEADDLGVRYLATGGYDPLAASNMLASLGAQGALDARIANRSGSTPTWASTHPDPASRVARTAQSAKSRGTSGGLRNRDAFLNAIDGMMYDDNPKQGIVDGQVFRHPVLKLTFTAPPGYALINGASAVTVSGQGGQAQFAGAPFTGDLRTYVQNAFNAIGGTGTIDAGALQPRTVNGLETLAMTVRANTQSGPVDATIQAYAFDPNTAYHFVAITPAGTGAGPLAPLLQSMRRLSASEAAAIRPRRVSVVTVKSGDTVQNFAARMAYSSYQLERFLTLNALSADAGLRPGQRVKLIVFG